MAKLKRKPKHKAKAKKRAKPARGRAKPARKRPARATKAARKSVRRPSPPKPRKPAKGEPRPAPKKAPTAEAVAVTVAAASVPAADDKGRKTPKGISIVSPRPMRRPRVKTVVTMPVSEPLIKPGGPKWKPLIPSGPKAAPTGLVGQGLGNASEAALKRHRLPKREMEKYRQILLRKRAELVGDVANMEDEALRQTSGSLSHVPQHMAEQGSDAFDQAMSLDLAAVDRNLIREIDEALGRIEAGTYGVCEVTGEPIKPERLAEIPWAKYSIEAARALERRPYQM